MIKRFLTRLFYETYYTVGGYPGRANFKDIRLEYKPRWPFVPCRKYKQVMAINPTQPL